MTAKSFKYWVINWLQMLGITIGVSLLIVLLQLGGSIDFSQDIKVTEIILMVQIGVFPYYMFFVSAFVIMMIGMGYFQVYFSTLVSMNVTRKEVAGGIIGTVAATIVAVIFIAAIIWKIVPGDIASDGYELLGLCAGILFLTAGVSLVIGLIVVKWGRIGGIIFFVMCVVIGGFAGGLAGSGLFDKALEMAKLFLLKYNFWWTMGIGLVVYVLSSVFIIVNTRKMEVRV